MKKIILIILFPFLFQSLLNSGIVRVKTEEVKELYILQKEKERKIAELKVRQMVTQMIIIQIESSFRLNAYNESENAAGLFQTRPIMVKEVNRLLGWDKYTLSDRYSITRSIEMFVDYNNVVNPEWDYEKSARMWNGGITGMKKSSTDAYWDKFSSYLSGS